MKSWGDIKRREPVDASPDLRRHRETLPPENGEVARPGIKIGITLGLLKIKKEGAG